MIYEPEKILYFDTSALNALKQRTHRANLYKACKEGRIQACVSETVIWELARQRHVYYMEEDPTSLKLDALGRENHLRGEVELHKVLYESHNIFICSLSVEGYSEMEEILSNPDNRFNPQIENDRRDVAIFLSAIKNFGPEEIICICEDTKLGAMFNDKGYEVCDDAKTFIEDIFGNCREVDINCPKVYLKSADQIKIEFSLGFTKELKKSDPNYAHIIDNESSRNIFSQFQEEVSSTDAELRLNILGYVNWYDPIAIKDLETRLSDRGFSAELIRHNAERLCIERIIKNTGNHLLPNKIDKKSQGICEQATIMMMDEILQELD